MACMTSATGSHAPRHALDRPGGLLSPSRALAATNCMVALGAGSAGAGHGRRDAACSLLSPRDRPAGAGTGHLHARETRETGHALVSPLAAALARGEPLGAPVRPRLPRTLD